MKHEHVDQPSVALATGHGRMILKGVTDKQVAFVMPDASSPEERILVNGVEYEGVAAYFDFDGCGWKLSSIYGYGAGASGERHAALTESARKKLEKALRTALVRWVEDNPAFLVQAGLADLRRQAWSCQGRCEDLKEALKNEYASLKVLERAIDVHDLPGVKLSREVRNEIRRTWHDTFRRVRLKLYLVPSTSGSQSWCSRRYASSTLGRSNETETP